MTDEQRRKEIPLFIHAIFSKDNSIIVMPNDAEAALCFFRLAQFIDSEEFHSVIRQKNINGFWATVIRDQLRIELPGRFIEIKSDQEMFNKMAQPVKRDY